MTGTHAAALAGLFGLLLLPAVGTAGNVCDLPRRAPMQAQAEPPIPEDAFSVEAIVDPAAPPALGSMHLPCPGDQGDPGEPPPPTPAHGAQFVSQTVPARMVAGQHYPISVQLKNVGTATWTTAAHYRLGAQNPHDNTHWGTHRLALPGSVAHGQVASIAASVRAPATAGTYHFQWRMVQDGVAWFGMTTPSVPVTVHAGAISVSPNPCVIAAGASVCATTVQWSSSASDAEVWVTDAASGTPRLFARAQQGTSAASWISARVARFHLKTGGWSGLTLATADAHGQAAPPSLPSSTATATRHYVHDAQRRLCKIIEPETGATVLGRDAAGNLSWSASGLDLTDTGRCDTDHPDVVARKVTRTYDARHRLRTLRFPDGRGDTDYAYTPTGALAAITVDNGEGDVVATTYAYDAQGQLTREHLRWGVVDWGIDYRYTANGHLAAQQWHGLTVDYAPDALGRPTRAGTFATGVRHHPNGAIRQFTYGNGIVHTLAQNARGLPEVRRDAHGGTAYLDDHYDYDANGNVAAISDGLPGARGDRTMAYDALDRLQRAASPMFGVASYAYDSLDNLTRVQVTGGSAARDHAHCHDERWRLTNIKTGSCDAGASVVGMGYDAQGNLRNRNGRGYTFDHGNRLRSVDAHGSQPASRYVYDGHGRRVLDAANGNRYSQYTHDGRLALTVDQRQGKVADYIQLGGTMLAIRERDVATNATSIKYLHTDALGSPVVVTDAQRRIVERTEYEPYGRVINGQAKDGLGYTGHVFDAATGLVQAQQRYLDTESGRFLSVDPVAADTIAGWNFNRYWYANNNPYKFTDPDGRAAHLAIGAGVGAVFGGGMELYRQLSAEGRVTSWTNIGIETAKGGVVGALTAAVPGSTALAFGGTTAKAAVSVGNAVAVGAGGEVAAQAARGESIDPGKALIAGVANGAGVVAGAAAAPFAKAAATTTVPGNPGFQVVSNRGRTFTVNAIPASTTTSEGLKQIVQDTFGASAASYVDKKLRSP